MNWNQKPFWMRTPNSQSLKPPKINSISTLRVGSNMNGLKIKYLETKKSSLVEDSNTQQDRMINPT